MAKAAVGLVALPLMELLSTLDGLCLLILELLGHRRETLFSLVNYRKLADFHEIFGPELAKSDLFIRFGLKPTSR